MPVVCIVFMLAASLLPIISAKDQFTYPPADSASIPSFPEWQYNQQQNITWSADFPTISLVLWQDHQLSNGETYFNLLLDTVPYQSSYSYNVNTTIDLALDNVFYLRLYNGNASSPTYVQSHRFEIIKSSASTTSSTATQTSTATATQTSTATTLTTTTTQVPATGTTQPSTGPDPNPSRSTSTNEIGLGVGLGLGLPFLAGLAAVGAILAKKKKKSRLAGWKPLYMGQQQQVIHGQHLLPWNDSRRISELGESLDRLRTLELEGQRAL